MHASVCLYICIYYLYLTMLEMKWNCTTKVRARSRRLATWICIWYDYYLSHMIRLIWPRGLQCSDWVFARMLELYTCLVASSDQCGAGCCKQPGWLPCDSEQTVPPRASSCVRKMISLFWWTFHHNCFHEGPLKENCTKNTKIKMFVWKLTILLQKNTSVSVIWIW